MRIGDVAAKTGMTPSALRAWEERYGVLQPERSAGGHRRYTDDDVARVLAIRDLIAAGHTVAAAAADVFGATAVTPSGGPVRYGSLAAAYAATRAVVAAEEPEELVAAVAAFVQALGGSVYPVEDAPADAVPFDIAFGAGPPTLAAAGQQPGIDPGVRNVIRAELERLLPPLVDDARTALARIHVAHRARRSAPSSERG